MPVHYGGSRVTPAAVPELVGVQPAGLVVLTQEQQHCYTQSGSSTGTLLPPAAPCPTVGRIAMIVLSPAQEQPQSHTAALLHSQTPCRYSPQSQ